MRYAIIVLFPPNGGEPDLEYFASYKDGSDAFKKLKADTEAHEKYERAEFLTKQGRKKKTLLNGKSRVNAAAAIPVQVQRGTHKEVDGKLVPVEELEEDPKEPQKEPTKDDPEKPPEEPTEDDLTGPSVEPEELFKAPKEKPKEESKPAAKKAASKK